MSYQKKLGKVKGDAGIAYIPAITSPNGDGQQYISFTASDNSALPEELQDPIPISSFVYQPKIVNNNLIFELTRVESLENPSAAINLGNVKGDPGTSIINTRIVTQLPNENNLSAEDKQALYIVTDANNAFADVAIYNTAYDNDRTVQPYIYLESFTRLSGYLTKEEAANSYYTQDQIRTQLGQITTQQNNIQSLIGNPPVLNIPDDNS